jgi:hypothetical protein
LRRTRHGRLDQALQDAKGPENSELPPTRLEEICRAFMATGIPRESAIEALEHAARGPSMRRAWAPAPVAPQCRLRRALEEFEELEAA